jgi:DNA polymerase-1
VKIAMVRMAERLRADGLRSRMLLQVHDELLFESPAAETDRLRAITVEVMESALPLDVPLKVDVKIGDDWSTV